MKVIYTGCRRLIKYTYEIDGKTKIFNAEIESGAELEMDAKALSEFGNLNLKKVSEKSTKEKK